MSRVTEGIPGCPVVTYVSHFKQAVLKHDREVTNVTDDVAAAN